VNAAPTIETERLRLRAWRDDDLDEYAALCADPEVMRFFGTAGEPYSREQSADQLARFRAHWDEHGFGLWCAADRGTDECLGFVGLAVPTFLPEILPAVEIGWRLARASWGKGLATEGARPCVDYAFGPLGLTRLVSIARPENHRSTNIMEKLGMRMERTTTHPEHRYAVVVYELHAR
jgi:RimJ/RimL family protein N-acetyltransferase